ncbi:MAG: 2-keto-4-pentenoate hydratase/2-oxohepta-3-ene-1,7-dioic acid hydratase in catechol pathway [Candidatus Azotimanducaceae bacterium]|jgi:2-keto-4-pentenoate hydratase/2-oxohepta-3-ene-1,7-dioic acid hydratase in catechol pathway
MTSLLEGGLDNETIASATNAKPSIPLSSVSLHAPIPLPGKILAISLNYGNHIAETNSKPCVPGPHADINLPMVPDKLDDDAECCLVISKRCKHVPADRAY